MYIEVEARVLGQRKQNLGARPLQLGDLPEQPCLADLIAHVVRAEVQAFEQRRADQRLVRFLSESEIATGAEQGKVTSGGYIDDDHKAAASAPVDVEVAAQLALTAHGDGLFQVVIDNKPVDNLSAPVAISEGSSIMFLRLVALAGG